MANYQTRSVNYTPRMTDLEAHDKLPPALKHVLETSPAAWSAYAVYRRWQKVGDVKAVIRWIEGGNVAEAKRPWFRGMPNPCVTLKIKPLRPDYG